MKFFDIFKKNITKNTVIVFSLVIVAFLIIKVTYGANSYEIVFNRAEGTEIMKTCHTDQNGKLDEDCIDTISGICSRWSPDSYHGNYQNNQINSSAFADMTFTENKNYYCVSMSSLDYNMGCYVCKADENIMHWSSHADGNSACPGGYYKSSTITVEDKCVTVVPDACYVCKNDKNVMKWDNNGDSDKNCSSGYESTDKIQSECVTIIPDACYVCKGNSNVMKWKNNGDSDSDCSSGYSSTDIPKNQCVIIENPKTGNILIFIVWILGIASICYAGYYYKWLKKF